jgi:hypothetical protein
MIPVELFGVDTVQRNRKSGFDSVEMTKVRAALPSKEFRDGVPRSSGTGETTTITLGQP